MRHTCEAGTEEFPNKLLEIISEVEIGELDAAESAESAEAQELRAQLMGEEVLLFFPLFLVAVRFFLKCLGFFFIFFFCFASSCINSC